MCFFNQDKILAHGGGGGGGRLLGKRKVQPMDNFPSLSFSIITVLISFLGTTINQFADCPQTHSTCMCVCCVCVLCAVCLG